MDLQAVIFDYGMVLSTAEDPESLRALQRITRLEEPALRAHYWRYRHAYDLGTLNGRSFWQAISQDGALGLGNSEIDQLIEWDVRMWSSLNDIMVRWVAAVQQAGFRTAILSNMGEELLGSMRRHFDWLQGFNHLTWSCELGIAKPDPAIYQHTCERLGVEPAAALFLDDKAENIEAALACGLQAIQFTTAEALSRELQARGLASRLPPVTPAA